MFNSKLIKLISHLKTDVLQHLSAKLQATNTNAVKLFQYIYQYNKDNYTHTNLCKATVYEHLFPNQKYTETRLLKTMSELTKIIENTIIATTTEEDFFYKKSTLLKFYLQNNLDNYFESEFKELDKFLKQQPDNIDLFYQKHILEELSIEFKLKENNRETNYNLLYNNFNLLSNIGKIRINNLALISLKKELKEEDINNNLYLAHLYANNLLRNNEEIYFDKCWKLLQTNNNNIAKNELRTIVVLLINYCIIKINEKKSDYLQYLHNLYSYKIEQDIILEENNTIAPSAYKNIVTISLRLNKLDFAESFIDRFTPYLPANLKDEVYHYNYAQLLFHKKDYEKTLTTLRNYSFKDIFYKLGARRLQIKCFYILQETDKSYYDVLQNALNSFKKNIYTNKELSEHYIQNDKAFLKFISKLIVINVEKDTRKLLDELKIATQTAEYDWLYETILKKLNHTNSPKLSA